MKITRIHIYRERNFHADPADKFIMEKVGIGMMAEMDKGETQDQVYADLSAQVETVLETEIKARQELFEERQKALLQDGF